MARLNENAFGALLGSETGVDLNALGETTIFTEDFGRDIFITRILITNASAAHPDTAHFSFGWDTGPADDLLPDSDWADALDNANKYVILEPESPRDLWSGTQIPVKNNASNNFKIDVNTVQGGVCTVDVYVFGFAVS